MSNAGFIIYHQPYSRGVWVLGLVTSGKKGEGLRLNVHIGTLLQKTLDHLRGGCICSRMHGMSMYLFKVPVAGLCRVYQRASECTLNPEL